MMLNDVVINAGTTNTSLWSVQGRALHVKLMSEQKLAKELF